MNNLEEVADFLATVCRNHRICSWQGRDCLLGKEDCRTVTTQDWLEYMQKAKEAGE